MSIESDELKETIYQRGSVISSSMNKHKQEVAGNFPELGLCNHCANLRAVVTEFDCKQATCYHHMTPLTGRHRIRECSSFWDRTYVGIQSLLDMNPIMIDPKNEIGF